MNIHGDCYVEPRMNGFIIILFYMMNKNRYNFG